MVRSSLNILRALFSDRHLAKLYEQRRALRPSEENRTWVNMVLAAMLLASVLLFLMSMAWSRQSMDAYIEQRANINLQQSFNENWQVAGPMADDCYDCYRSLSEQAAHSPRYANLDSWVPQLPESLYDRERVTFLIKRKFIPNDWSNLLASGEKMVIHLPRFNYDTADVYFRSQHVLTLHNSARLAIPFDTQNLDEAGAYVEVVFKVKTADFQFFEPYTPGLNLLEKNVAVMTLNEERRYEDFLSANRAGRGDFIGAIARVVMAVFVLVLFMIIDGSPETLGLGLFLGFEGLAISTGYGWLPIENTDFLQHFCFQMGDIFRLYFFLQLARVIDKNVVPWLVWGTVVSIPYGLLRYYGGFEDFTWLPHIPASRDILVGSIGVIVCFRSMIYLLNKRLPWRVIALGVAGLASLEQTIDPLSVHVTSLQYIPGFNAFVNVMQPASAWLIAFSAFINISTLENRVARLSEIATHAKTIEKEMELARAVQQAFLHLPKMPSDVNLVCHHEAMLYVSGDTYFADWNEKNRRLTFLINDVTGHGIQAALKASGVSVIASTVWNHTDVNDDEPGKVQKYAGLVEDFFGRMNDNPDIVAMGGGEFDLRTGEVTLYRKNFPFPVMISPKAGGLPAQESRKDDKWIVQLLTIPNDTNVTIKITPGTFIVFTSDGFMESSRIAHDFLRHLRKNIGHEDSRLCADKIKKLILECQSFKTDVMPDDRTLTVFQWHIDSDSAADQKPKQSAA